MLVAILIGTPVAAAILIIGTFLIHARWPKFFADSSDQDCYK